MPGKVVVLDNEKYSISLLGQLLRHLDVVGYSDIHEFFAQGDSETDCIVLDATGMTEEDDQLFQMLRDNPNTQSTPVIYVGDNLSIQTRLAIYEAGVDDYISKPFDVAELQAKVGRALHHRRYERELISTAEVAKQAAFEAMTHSAEQGEIVRYMEQISACQKLDDLAEALLGLLSRFGLNAVFSCWQDSDEWPRYYSQSDSGGASALEEDLMQSGHGGGRIMEFGRRMLVNYPQTSLFLKNIPYEDEIRFGRIKDHLAVILNATDARVASLNMEARLRQKDELLDVVNEAEQTLHERTLLQKNMMTRVESERADLALELKEELLVLSLHDEQEERVLSLVSDHMNSLDALYKEAADWNEAIAPVMKALEYVVNGGKSD